MLYISYRNIYNRVIRAAKISFFNEKIDQNFNPKEARRFLNRAFEKSEHKSSDAEQLNENIITFCILTSMASNLADLRHSRSHT